MAKKPAPKKVCKKCGVPQAPFPSKFPVKNKVLQDVCWKCVKAENPPNLDEKAEKLTAKANARKAERERMTLLRSEQRRIARERERSRKQNRKTKLARNAASEELAARELARRRLLAYTMRFNDKYDAGWVHKVACARLERFSRDITAKKSPRLMMFMPPRTGKSELASKSLPGWHLGHNPDHEIIASSYAVSLPLGFSREIKNIVQQPSYSTVFKDMKLDQNAQATTGWRTTKGGGYLPAGVGSGITGKGAHCLIIDDPVADANEADSENQRQVVWDWWDSTADTRLAPGAGVLVILTRWHDDDLAGRMLRRMSESNAELEEEREANAEALLRREITRAQFEEEERRLDRFEEEIMNWDVLSFPALAIEDEWMDSNHNIIAEPEARLAMGDEVYDRITHKRQGEIADGVRERTAGGSIEETNGLALLRVTGEALHPTRYDERHFRRKKRNSQPRFWSALYQQNPVPDEGVYFKKDHFRYEPTVPDYREMKLYAAFDLAIGERQVNDWTVGIIGAHDPDDRIHILNLVRVRTNKLAEFIIGSVKPYKDQLQLVGLERGQIQMAVMPSLEREMARQQCYLSFDEDLKPVTDKMARARPAQGRFEQGRILLPANQPWVETFTQELLRFPGGLHDDQVDAVAWLVRMIERQSPPARRKARKESGGWRKRLNKTLSRSRNKGAMAA